MQDDKTRTLLVIGADGALGSAFARLCGERGLPHRLLARREINITSAASIEAALAGKALQAVVNADDYGEVDDAEREPYVCLRRNALGPALLAAACARRGARLLTFSSDLVFDGRKAAPYVEGDSPAPLGVYGRSKAEAETRVLQTLPSGALVVRTGPLFGAPGGNGDAVSRAMSALARGCPVPAASDTVISPTYAPDLAAACLDLLLGGERGLWHLANRGETTWADFLRRAAERAGLDAAGVEDCPGAALGHAAPRPRYSVLGSERDGGSPLPPLDDALARYAPR
jgi:dTDP-4-dehydrorhamnose reductase